MLKFTTTTTIEFKKEADLEAFVKMMPFEPHQIVSILEGQEFTDDKDQVEFKGAGKTVHTFKVTKGKK